MSVYNWLCLFGIPSLFLIAIKYLYNRIRENDKKTEAVKLGVQALLRDRLIHEYDKWSERRYAPIYARENFNNMWKQYHNLGVNGVMDDTHDKFMKLPINPPGGDDA